MTITKRILALVCVLTLCASLFAACKKEEDPATSGQATTQAPTSGGTNTPVVDSNKINYVVTLKSVTGVALSDVVLIVYGDEALTDMQGYATTDKNGQAVFSLAASGDYYVVLADGNIGYVIEGSNKLSGINSQITLKPQVIADTDVSGVTYKLGSVMHDIEFTDTKGVTHKLSQVLQEKDMVMLNFWYSTCGPCIDEFPYIQAAYEKYGDDVEIFALNPTDETMDSMALTQSSMGMTFPMGADTNAALYTAFNAGGTPTTVIIDRYGVVCLVVEGSLPDESIFDNMFNAFIGESYTQKLYHNGLEDLIPEVKPNVDMPSSEEIGAVLNGGSIEVEYHGEADDEMSWPFVITNQGGADCVKPANAGVSNSYAILYANVTMKAGEALALDYFASSEAGADILYIMVDRNDIYQISGVEDDWKTCYPWVATEDGVYEVALCYLKDGSDDMGDDGVYVKNLRILDAKDVDVVSYIPRFAATNMNEDGFGYQNYITPVFNKKDGYYHVGTADGPLLMANLMMSTRFSNDSIFNLADSGHIVVDGVNYYDQLVTYCSYASNSQIYSMVPVNEELKGLLQKVAEAVGIEQSENEWLQICEYYDAYGTGGKQLANPILGLGPDSAYPAKLGTNSVTYNRVIMPRGLLYKFVPEKSGVYRITSDSDFELEAWVFLREDLSNRDKLPFYTYEPNERMYYSETNVSMVLYMEAGKEYFIDIAYFDIYSTGTFTFDIEYEAKELNLFVYCSPGFFTYEDETTYELIAGGIKVALGKDGYYHELLSNGTQGSIVYADFVAATGIFPSNTILGMLEQRAFNFALSEDDETVLDYYDQYQAAMHPTDGSDVEMVDFETYMRDIWAADFDYYWDYLKVDEVLDGIYHGTGKDMTAVVEKYVSKMASSGDKEGCVAVTEELAEALQMLVDKYSYKDVENSWIKLCYYYDYFGPNPNK